MDEGKKEQVEQTPYEEMESRKRRAFHELFELSTTVYWAGKEGWGAYKWFDSDALVDHLLEIVHLLRGSK